LNDIKIISINQDYRCNLSTWRYWRLYCDLARACVRRRWRHIIFQRTCKKLL